MPFRSHRMPLTRESPPFRGKLNKFPVQIARAAVERRDFCFHNNRSSLRATFSDVIPRDEGTRYTHGRERPSIAQVGMGLHFPSLFPRPCTVPRCTGASRRRASMLCVYLTRHVRANKLHGVLCVGVFAPHAEFSENVAGLQRPARIIAAAAFSVTGTLRRVTRDVPMRIRVPLVNRHALSRANFQERT